MDVKDHIAKAVEQLGSQAKLGRAAGNFSQNAIHQPMKRNSVSPELALGIHRATKGAVPASELRPDLWERPEDVPHERVAP